MTLLEACVAWDGVVGNAVLVVIWRVLGELIEDEEVVAPLTSVPEWCFPSRPCIKQTS